MILGFRVTKIKTDTAGACFQKSRHNQPAPSRIGLTIFIQSLTYILNLKTKTQGWRAFLMPREVVGSKVQLSGHFK